MPAAAPPSGDDLLAVQRLLESFGLSVKIGG